MKNLLVVILVLTAVSLYSCDSFSSSTDPHIVAAFTPLYNGTNTVRFRNDSSGASYYQWHSGDGQTRSGVFEPEFFYPEDGTYLATLRACPGTNVNSNKCKRAEEHVTVPR